MAEDTKFQLGELGPFDYSSEPNAELSEEAEKALGSLATEAAKRDASARRLEVDQAWEQRLFYRGYQYLLPDKRKGWILASTRITGASQYDVSSTETNIYGTHCDILTSALVRDIPQCRFEPVDPNSDQDITAADKAADYKDIFAIDNDLKSLHLQAANYMCTDGRVLFYTRHVLDGQRFGFESEADANAVVPEDETNPIPDSPESKNESQAVEEIEERNQSPVGGRKPRGKEITDVYGKLEHKVVPMGAQTLTEVSAVLLSYEVDVSMAKGRFPDLSDKIVPGDRGIAELELDRTARINTKSGLQGAYVTGDGLKRETTIQHVWFRPSAFMEASSTAKEELFKAFPDGCLAIWAGKQFILARNECMDNHLHILHAFPGNGMNRASLLSKLVSVQKRLNNWLDLLNDFFLRTIPRIWMDSEAFNMEALRNQTNVPGSRGPFISQPQKTIDQLILVETPPTPQPALPEFINYFFTQFPEMLSGALPALFGAESNQETAAGMSMQRDQALGRLSSPWGAIQSATAAYFRQAVMSAAACRSGSLTNNIPGKGKVTLEVADLKGNVLCFPNAGTNFPDTWIQRRDSMKELLTVAPANPFIARLFSVKKNMKLIKDGIGLMGMEFPEADSVDKQLGEIEVLLKTGPVPNPQITEAEGQVEQMLAQAQAAGELDKAMPMVEQIKQGLAKLPPLVSSIAIDYEIEDHATEAEVCQQWCLSATGRKFKNGTPEDRESYQNVRLHGIEHMDAAKQKIQESMPPPPLPKLSLSSNLKDLPAEETAAILKQNGVAADPENIHQKEATDVEKEVLLKSVEPGNKNNPIFKS